MVLKVLTTIYGDCTIQGGKYWHEMLVLLQKKHVNLLIPAVSESGHKFLLPLNSLILDQPSKKN